MSAVEMYRGEDKTITYTILQSNGSSPQNITGWTMTFRVASAQWGAAILTKVPTLTSPTTGECTVQLASADTSSLTQDGLDTTYYFDLRRTDSGSRTELDNGSLVIHDTNTNG